MIQNKLIKHFNRIVDIQNYQLLVNIQLEVESDKTLFL